MVVHALRHKRNRKRRLFAGKDQAGYNKELRLRRLEAGRVPRKRKLIAGQAGIGYRRELARMRVEEGRGAERRLFSHHLKGEFGGYVKDPRVRRTPRRSRATGKPRRVSAREARYLHTL